MKTFLCLLLICLATLSLNAQTNSAPKHHHKKDKDTNSAPAEPAEPKVDPAAQQASQVQAFQKAFVPTDPWRIIDEHTNFAKGGDWVQFEGTVSSVSTSGAVVRGWFDAPLAYMLPNHPLPVTTFLLSGYPRALATGSVLSRNDRLVAKKADSKDGMQNLIYGAVWAPELTEEQKAQASQAKNKAQSKVLAWHQELADKGDAYGQYKMGLHYLNGDGVDKDLAKAKEWFSKSAAQGNKEAEAELAKIPAN